MALLNPMANFNEKTVTRMNMIAYRKFNIAEQGLRPQLQFAEWNHNTGHVSVGGASGLLKVVKFSVDSTNAKQTGQINSLSVNQALEGHTSTVLRAIWNENHQKLTTSDTSGMIIVWGYGGGDQWVEEMINNRNKSVVVGTAWNYNGTKICIAYADGNVIVGTLNGDRLWNSELGTPLIACEYCPHNDLLIFGTEDGRVKVHDEEGNPFLEIRMHCLEQMELEHVLSRDRDHQEKIVCISYWSPTLKSKVMSEFKEREKQKEREKEQMQVGGNVFANYPRMPQKPEKLELERAPEPIQPVPADRPRLMIIYVRGVFQLMRSISDTDPVVDKLPSMRVSDAKWSPNGAFVAVSGTAGEKEDSRLSVVHFLTAYGQRIGYFQSGDTRITGLGWHPSGLRIVAATDDALLLGQVRPEFKWGAIEDTVIYVFQKEEQYTYTVMFYDYKTEEKIPKNVDNFEHLAFYKDYCIIICGRKEDWQDLHETFYTCELCNCIGTSLDYTTTTFEPKYVCLNSTHAVLADENRFFIWHFVLPKLALVNAGGQEIGVSTEYILSKSQRVVDMKTNRSSSTRDYICNVCIGDTFFLLGLRNGGIYRGNLADGVLTDRYEVPPAIDSMKLNCDFTKLAVAKLVENVPYELVIYDFVGNNLLNSFTCEKKDIWDYQWDHNDPNMLVLKDKQKIVIFDGSSLSEQSLVNGYIFSFKDLVIRLVNLEMLLMHPENPSKQAFQEVMIRAKQDVTTMLNTNKLDEAIEYAEKNSHAELWTMIANYALVKHLFDIAEMAFVKLADYAGVQFVKKLRNIGLFELRNAEILAYANKFDEAAEEFLHCDRKDLAIEMYKKVGDYIKVYDLIKNDEDKESKVEAYREIAQQFYEAMEWEDASIYFEKCGDITMLIDSLIRCKEFGKLEELARGMPEGGEYLEQLGDIFASHGLCDQACECYLKVQLPRKALKTCIELNKWHMAKDIAGSYNLENLDELMGKNGEPVIGGSDERSVNTLGLYMRVGRHLEAAKIAFEIADDRRLKFKPYTDLKQCYVLGGILVEQYRQSVRDGKYEKHKAHEEVLEDEVGLTVDQIRILENTWKGAEAFHYMILAQQHFFNGNIENALQTSLILANYEEYLDAGDVHEMIALAAANVGQFGICSRAMMKLESYEKFTDEEREEKKELSFRLFSKNDPVNPAHANVSCRMCDGEMNPYDLECPKCYVKFPLCVATGKPIQEPVFWQCSQCNHHAQKEAIEKFTFCPLCHYTRINK